MFLAALGQLPVFWEAANTPLKVPENPWPQCRLNTLSTDAWGHCQGRAAAHSVSLALEPVPDLLLLDEPISGVDFKGMQCFYRIVAELRQQYDLSVILVSHDLNAVADYADRVVLLNQVILCDGTPQEVMKSQLFEATLGRMDKLLPV